MRSNQRQRIPKLYPILLFLCVFTGCSNLVLLPDQPQVLLHKSEPQILKITNTHGAPIAIIPLKDSDPVIHIPIDGAAQLMFRVIVVADLKQPQSLRPQWLEIASSYLVYSEPLDGPGYLKHGPDEVITLDHQISGASQEIRINFQRCRQGRSWQNMIAPAAEHRVNSNQIAAIPVRLCPQLSN